MYTADLSPPRQNAHDGFVTVTQIQHLPIHWCFHLRQSPQAHDLPFGDTPIRPGSGSLPRRQPGTLRVPKRHDWDNGRLARCGTLLGQRASHPLKWKSPTFSSNGQDACCPSAAAACPSADSTSCQKCRERHHFNARSPRGSFDPVLAVCPALSRGQAPSDSWVRAD